MSPARDANAAPRARFTDRLAGVVAARESQVVLGLDPDPARLWPQSLSDISADGPPAARAARAVAAHCRALIDAAGPACCAAKPQLACFERLGAPGWAALAEVVAYARDAGLLVLADGKRGDIAVSAAAYGQALVGSTPTPFGTVEGLGADAFTANPYLGVDTLETLLEAARAARAGVFVLVRTSNPGAADLEDLPIAAAPGAVEGPLWERVATIVDALGRAGATPPDAGHATDAANAGATPSEHEAMTPLHDVGAVVGATVPEHVARMRDLMPNTVFLLPGIGAQGGRVEDLAPAFAPHRAAGLVTASRSIASAHEKSPDASPEAAARAEAERLRAAAWELA